MEWIYKNKGGIAVMQEPPKGTYGFVYEISVGSKRYIGKKNFYTVRKRNFGKKEIAKLTDKRLKKYEYVTKESNWRDYTSSNSEVNRLIDSGIEPRGIILEIAYCKKQLTYIEEWYLYTRNVLNRTDYLNDNIAGRFYTSDIEKWQNLNSE